jgi:hypothetical protein
MQDHCTKKYGWKRAQGDWWQQAMVQTFFKSDKTKYFVVTPIVERRGPEPSRRMVEDCIKALLEEAEIMDVAEDEQLGVVEANRYMMDKSPRMRRTGWLREFGGKDMNVIVGKSKKPTKEEGVLQVVWTSVMRLMNHCVEGVQDCGERNWSLIAFWLNT